MPQPLLFKLRESPVPARGFAPIIPHRAIPAPVVATTFDPTKISHGNFATLSNGNLTATGINGTNPDFGGVGTTTTRSNGKWVVGFSFDSCTATGTSDFGFADTAFDFTDIIQFSGNAHTIAWRVGTAIAGNNFWVGTTFIDLTTINGGGQTVPTVVGRQVQLLLDFTAQQLYLAVDGSPICGMNPVAGTGGISFAGMSVPLMAALAHGDTNVATIKPSAPGYVPAGYSTWDPPSGSGNVWQFISSVSESWSESATLARLRANVSTATIAWSESSALSRLRAFISSQAEAWSESSTLTRIRSLAASAVTAAWSETSRIGRLAVLGASAVAEVWSESATITRIRGGVSSVAIAFAESSALSRLRAFVSSTAQIWSETAIVSRARQFAASSVSAAWAETSALARLRAFVSSQAATWSETSALSRLRAFVSSTAAKWSEIASVAPIKLLSASSVAAVWSEASATVLRIRSFLSSVAESWLETSALSRLRGAVSASTAQWTDGASLSRARLLASSAAAAWVEGSALNRLRGLGSQSAAQWAETSVIVRRRSLSSSSVAAVWVETSIYGATFHPAVTTPTSRRDIGTIAARHVTASTPSRRIAPNLQARRPTH